MYDFLVAHDQDVASCSTNRIKVKWEKENCSFLVFINIYWKQKNEKNEKNEKKERNGNQADPFISFPMTIKCIRFFFSSSRCYCLPVIYFLVLLHDVPTYVFDQVLLQAMKISSLFLLPLFVNVSLLHF